MTADAQAVPSHDNLIAVTVSRLINEMRYVKIDAAANVGAGYFFRFMARLNE